MSHLRRTTRSFAMQPSSMLNLSCWSRLGCQMRVVVQHIDACMQVHMHAYIQHGHCHLQCVPHPCAQRMTSFRTSASNTAWNWTTWCVVLVLRAGCSHHAASLKASISGSLCTTWPPTAQPLAMSHTSPGRGLSSGGILVDACMQRPHQCGTQCSAALGWAWPWRSP